MNKPILKGPSGIRSLPQFVSLTTGNSLRCSFAWLRRFAEFVIDLGHLFPVGLVLLPSLLNLSVTILCFAEMSS